MDNKGLLISGEAWLDFHSSWRTDQRFCSPPYRKDGCFHLVKKREVGGKEIITLRLRGGLIGNSGSNTDCFIQAV